MTGPGLAERLVEAGSPLGQLEVSASVRGEVLVEHPPRDAADPGRLWNVWCAAKPPVACAVLALLERAGVDPTRPLHEYVPIAGDVADPSLTAAALLRHESRLPPLDPVEVQMLAPDERPAHLRTCLAGRHRRAAPVAAYSQLLGWSVLLAAVEAVHGEDPEALVQCELLAAGHPDVLVAVAPPAHAAIEARLGLYTSGTGRFERPLVHDRARSVVVHGGAALRGYASASSLRRWYEDLGATLHGHRPETRAGFPSTRLLADLLGAPRVGDDLTLRRRCSFAGGFMVDLAGHHAGPALSRRAVGHAGWRGLSMGAVDPDRSLAVGFVHQRTGPAALVASTRARVLGLVADAAA